MMKELIDKIQDVNKLIYMTKNHGRCTWGDKWSERWLEDGLVWAAFLFKIRKKECDEYLKFTNNEYYWSKLEQDLRYKAVGSQDYASLIKEYFKKYITWIRKADYQTLREGAFIVDLLDDGYISQEEADDYCKLLVNVQDKAVKDGKRAYKILLGITGLKVEAEIQTPALDFLFHSKVELRNRFIAFFKSKHGKLKITASDVVQILFLALNGRNRFDALEKNGFSSKYLWNDLRLIGVLGNIVKDVKDRTLNIAAQKASQPKPDVKAAWDSSNK